MIRRLLAGLTSSLLFASSFATTHAAGAPPSAYAGLHWREIGPLRGGRTKSIAGVPSMPNRFYIGAVNGGVWRTDNAGLTWNPIFDSEPTQSIGAVVVAPSDPQTVYVGSGEGLQRPDLSVGNGVYRSLDAGATWTHLGLRNAQQISRIAVDPTNPKRLFVAALGHPYGPNDERGIYRSTDGGDTFSRVLFKNDNVGAYDVSIDPKDPNVVYATLWAARQAPWEIGSSFEIAGSGIFKSTDGGDHWTQLTNGIPAKIGRAEIAIAPDDPSVVYTYIDGFNDSGGSVYRSADAGEHFVKTNSDQATIGERGDDLVAIAAADAHTLYLNNTTTYESTDDGKTFVGIKGAPGGDDYQGTWLNPRDRNIVALVSDQGATISVDGGKTWSSWYNQPTAQMYHVSADNRFPYWVCGGQQESGSACVESRGDWGQVNERDWHTVGAEEYGYVVPDPLHPGVTFGGKVERFDERTNQATEVSPNPLRDGGFRVVRTEPLAFDPLDLHTLLFGANRIYATSDSGMHWHAISPDLTRPTWSMPSVIADFESGDASHGKHRGVVYALAPSYRHHGTIWAGTDDGLVWITRDGGARWKNITPPQLTPWSKIAQIDASHDDDNTAYVAVNRFRLDDQRPYVYRTHDGGAHWTLITNGLPNGPVNAVREDPHAKGLLYAAGEGSVSVSFDDGEDWQSLQLNLPPTSMRDIIVHDNDLIVATHGRGFWILDDIEPLREIKRSASWSGTHLFAPEIAYRVQRNTNTDTPLPPEIPHGTNPPDGAIIDYTLADSATRVTLQILNARGDIVRSFSSDDVAPVRTELDKPTYWERPFTKPSADAGMHRFVWDLHEATPASVAVDLPISGNDDDTPRVPQGAFVAPGRYTVALSVDGKTMRAPLDVVMDPREHTSQRDLDRQYEMAHETATLLDRTDAAFHRTHADAMSDLNGELTALMQLIEGSDAPVPGGTQSAFCSLQAKASAALGMHQSSSLCTH